MLNPTSDLENVASQISAEGYAIIPQAVDQFEVSRLINTLADLPYDAAARRRRGRGAFARRNLLEIPEVRELSVSPALLGPVTSVLRGSPFPVRGILFDKTADANWVVPWHQDLSIAVAERIETVGFGPWSVKAGVTHVQPPVGILQQMVTVRLHLDDCGADNGPLRVIPGSHRSILTPEEFSARVASSLAVSCHASAGDLLLMAPLILHSSSPATSPRNRRVIHLEYASIPLPGALRWNSVSDEVQ